MASPRAGALESACTPATAPTDTLGDAPDASLDITSWSFAPLKGDAGAVSRVAVADLRDGASSPGGSGRLFTTTSRLTFSSGAASSGIVDLEVRVWQRPDEPVKATLYLSGEGNGVLGGGETAVAVDYDSAADCVTVELLWEDVWQLVEIYADRDYCKCGDRVASAGSAASDILVAGRPGGLPLDQRAPAVAIGADRSES